MKDLHNAALKRAYRTLAQGLGGSATSTALAALLAALVGSEQTVEVAAITAFGSIGTTLIAASASFWQGVVRGLPEASDGA
jgi:hypothetical protein